MHNVPYVGHPAYRKSIIVVRSQYFLPGIKKEVANYTAQCLEFQKVKTKNIPLAGMLQPFPIKKWKWEVVTIYFIPKIPIKVKKHESIMVMVDKWTKEAHFIPLKTIHKEKNIVEIYMNEVSKIHWMPKEIFSDKDSNFTSKCWQALFKGFGTNMNLRTTYLPDSYGKIERTNRMVEDMLKMYVMD